MAKLYPHAFRRYVSQFDENYEFRTLFGNVLLKGLVLADYVPCKCLFHSEEKAGHVH